jgi:hypothetical protein
MEKETVKFEVTLSGTYWDKIPEFSIKIGDQELIHDSVSESKTFTFEVELLEGHHILKIHLLNKSDSDTIQNQDKTEIIKDMLLNIESITIDDIEIETLKWSASEFIPEDSKREILTNCVNLGWNGCYQIKFESPVYLWLLENL